MNKHLRKLLKAIKADEVLDALASAGPVVWMGLIAIAALAVAVYAIHANTVIATQVRRAPITTHR